jgi:hypothetical protein
VKEKCVTKLEMRAKDPIMYMYELYNRAGAIQPFDSTEVCIQRNLLDRKGLLFNVQSNMRMTNKTIH